MSMSSPAISACSAEEDTAVDYGRLCGFREDGADWVTMFGVVGNEVWPGTCEKGRANVVLSIREHRLLATECGEPGVRERGRSGLRDPRRHRRHRGSIDAHGA